MFGMIYLWDEGTTLWNLFSQLNITRVLEMKLRLPDLRQAFSHIEPYLFPLIFLGFSWFYVFLISFLSGWPPNSEEKSERTAEMSAASFL